VSEETRRTIQDELGAILLRPITTPEEAEAAAEAEAVAEEAGDRRVIDGEKL